jgi:cysteine desulfurase/selenocysteine lyase
MAVDVQELGCDFYAFSSHKMFGPTGIGALWGRAELLRKMPPYQGGGDMIRSVTFEETTYNQVPYKFEAGTPNTVGIAGLQAGVEFVLSEGVNKIKQREEELVKLFIGGIRNVPGIILYGENFSRVRIPVVSFNITGMDPGALAFELDEHYNIMSRAGLHCAPSAHKTIGTFPSGTVRFSFSYFNTEDEIAKAIEALRQISKG